jgi:CHAT domain-containing protein
MQVFYRHLNQGLRPEQALLQTQQELRRHPDGFWMHPFHWAAFQLYGRRW